MATLVLTTVGTLFGGPIGGAIGALAGQVFDQTVLFRPKGGSGPRLSDLHVQTSTYGTQIPALFGRMRVAGTVIWATDLKESVSRSGGGKRKPSVTTYSYSASLAVALSSRPVRSVGRIWADGKLLRGAEGDFKSGIGACRLHDGGEDQPVDPLIASSTGPGEAPAHRGLAYMVLEDLALEDFGNRIPSLTFEVVADEGETGMDVIAGFLGGGEVTADAGAALTGYAASGPDARAGLEPLIAPLGLRPMPGAGRLHLAAGSSPAGSIDPVEELAAINGKRVKAGERTRGSAGQVPVRMSVRHYDPERDYQAGVQVAFRPGPGARETQAELPAVVSAGAARGMAEKALSRLWTGRSRLEITAGWPQLLARPGSIVTVAGEAGSWAVKAREWDGMGVRLTLEKWASESLPPLPAASGAAVGAEDVLHGATRLMAVDLPALTDEMASAPRLFAAAAGAGAGWRRAALFKVDARDAALIPIGGTAAPAVMGEVVVPPGAGQPWVIDGQGAMEVALMRPDMHLESADDAALVAGENLCLAGGELMQFGRAEALGGGRWRLSRLVRGRRGSEWAMGEQAAGAPFLMLAAECLAAVPTESAAIGQTLRLAAIGIGDVVPAEAEVTATGEAVRPPSPVAFGARSDGAGGTILAWTRRSRDGWAWRDGIDAPLVEEREAYRVTLTAGGAVFRQVEASGPGWTYGADMIAVDGTAGQAVRAEIVQIGSLAVSRPLAGMFTA